jgi:preprotein translocase subunit SecD
MQSIESRLKKDRIPLSSKKVEKNILTLTFDNLQQAQDVAHILKSDYKELTPTVEGSTIRLQFTENIEKRVKDNAVERNIDVLRSRLDRFSVAEIPITRQGEKNIIVELPDVANPQEAKERIGRAANLEFKLVEKTGRDKQELLLEYDGELPDDLQIVPGEKRDGGFYVVQRFAQVTGRMLIDAHSQLCSDDLGRMSPCVAFEFNEEGAEKFYDLTSKNYHRNLAIVLDDVVISAPEIQQALKSTGVIRGLFTLEETKTLAALLKAGSFVAPVTFEEERQIGPSLGEESIQKGLMSCLIGLAILFVFSLYYYRLSGVLAFLALVYNLIIVLLGLAWLKATLTLPGIAGMVLTIGMAIDAAILIFERVKDEIAAGSGVKKAVDTGFSGALAVIMDSNITTFIAGVVLYNVGSGPVQGFAVTLMLGIVATLLATLFFLRSFFKFILTNFSIQKLSI